MLKCKEYFKEVLLIPNHLNKYIKIYVLSRSTFIWINSILFGIIFLCSYLIYYLKIYLNFNSDPEIIS